MLHARAANIRCDRYCSNFLDFGVELNKGLELDIRRVEPNSDLLAIWSPVDACDGTAVIVDDQKLRRGPTGCIPQVYRVTQSNGQQVVAPSVEQVEVLVVINKLWCV